MSRRCKVQLAKHDGNKVLKHPIYNSKKKKNVNKPTYKISAQSTRLGKVQK